MRRGIVIFLLLAAGLMVGCLGGTLGTAVDLPVKPTSEEISARVTNNWTRGGLLGKVKTVTTFWRDEDGVERPMAQEEFSLKGNIWKSTRVLPSPISVIEYDENRRIIRRTHKALGLDYRYEGDKVTIWQAKDLIGEGKTDRFGNMIGMKILDSKIDGLALREGQVTFVGIGLESEYQGKDGKTIYEYNENGQIIQRVIKSLVTGERRAVYQYDEKGNLLKVVEDGMPYYWYEYVEFDGQGNWTKRYFIIKDGKQREERREISYYEK